MKDLITEVRELCEKATPGPWKVVGEDAWRMEGFPQVEMNTPDGKYFPVHNDTDAAFIARSRTLIPELCDALEKAEEQNKQLIREVSALAAESVKRDVALARLEAEVEAACNSVRWIPVTERLPERNDKILAYTPPKPGYAELCEVTRGFMARLGKRSCITHWRPLPAAPEEGAEK